MAVLYTPHFVQFFENDGVTPAAGGLLYTYSAGTTTPKAAYTTSTGDVAHTNPIVLDSAGRATIFITGSYKFLLTDSDGNTIKTTDNVTSFNATTATNEGFYQTFSGDAATTAFTLSQSLGEDEKALEVFSELEYSTNGTFASDASWTKGSGWTISAGVATATGAISTALEQSAGITVLQGKAYLVKYTVTRSAGSITPNLGGTAGTARSADGTYSEIIICGSTQVISFTTSSFTGTLDTVSVRDIGGLTIRDVDDYTVSGTALTFTKAPATGTNNIQVRAPYTLVGSAGAAQTAADQAIAAQAAAEGATNAVAYRFAFDSSTTMADPGTGDFRLNNATLSSVTEIAVDALSSVSGNPDVSDVIAVWGASTSTVKGQIKISKSGAPATFALYNITAAVTDNTDWLQITVAHVASNGTFTAADQCYFQFTRTGDLGATGATGATTVSGATSGTMVADDKVLFLDTSASDALKYDDPATIDISIFGSGSATDGQVLTADGAGGAAFETLPTTTSGWVPIKTVTASAVSSVDFVNGSGGVVLDGTYKAYAIVITALVPATDNSGLWIRTSSNASTFDSGASDYAGSFDKITTAGSSTISSSGSQEKIIVATGIGNAAEESFSGILYLYNPAGTRYCVVDFHGSYVDNSGVHCIVHGGGMRKSAADVDGIRFLMDSGNITSGTFTLYGIKDA